MSRNGPVRPYRSRFADWDTSASVRSRPLVTLPPQGADQGLFFSPDLVPTLHHHLVARRGPRAAEIILARHLINYLDFTDELENVVVTPVAYRLGRGIADFELGRRMRLDARRIAVDEMYHALCATEVMEDIAVRADVALPPTRMLPFLAGLEAIFARADPRMRPLLMTFFAVVSETLITGSLQQVPGDQRVQHGVRRILADHAEDEARHHAFFADLLGILWPQLSPEQRTLIGPVLPGFITIFLGPDLEFEAESLRQIELDEREVMTVLEESYSDPNVNLRARQHAAATLRYVRRYGLLEDERTRDAFVEAGFDIAD